MAGKDKNFTERRQDELRNVMNICARDTDMDVSDPEHENIGYFALCMRSNVATNPVLNQCKAVRSAVNGWTYQ